MADVIGVARPQRTHIDDGLLDEYGPPMPRHNVTLKLHAEVPVGNVDIEIPVRIDDALRGRLQISTGTVDWRSRNSRTPVQLTWSQLADLLEAHGTPKR
jgi:hypothetical protein